MWAMPILYFSHNLDRKFNSREGAGNWGSGQWLAIWKSNFATSRNISRRPSILFGRGNNQKEGYSFLMIWDETRTNDAHSLNDLVRGDQSYTITYNGLIGSYKLSRVVIDPHLDGRLSPREPRVNATSLRAKERWLRETGGIRLVIAVISTAVLWTRGCQGLQTLIQRQIL